VIFLPFTQHTGNSDSLLKSYPNKGSYLVAAFYFFRSISPKKGRCCP